MTRFSTLTQAAKSGQGPKVATNNVKRPLSPLREPLRWKAERDPNAKMLFLQSFLRKGVSSGYVGRNHKLKDLNDLLRIDYSPALR